MLLSPVSSLCTTLSLQWEPEIIAVAVMYLAGRLCKFEIQEWTSRPVHRRWWEQFVQDVPVDVLEGTSMASLPGPRPAWLIPPGWLWPCGPISFLPWVPLSTQSRGELPR